MIWQRPPPDCLSSLAIDQLLGEELAAATRQAALAHIGICPRCAARFDEIESARNQFRAAPPPVELPAPRRRMPTLALAFAGAAAAAAVLLFLVRVEPGPGSAPAPAVTQVKGSMRLGVFIKRGDVIVAGRGRDIVHPGDSIRFTYSSGASGYLVVLSRDGAGRISIYYPDGESAAPIEAADQELLPGSIILDDILGVESIYGVRCDTPIAVARIEQELNRRGHEMALPGCTVDRLTLDKRP
jgi:hypothetical protein